ncbi:MAG: sigma factor, partial [Planctomycetota bacterium]
MTSPDWIDQADVTWIRALARSLTRDDGAADDATQDTLLVWMQRFPGRSAPRGWLRRVLENRLRQGARADRRRRDRELGG